MTDRAPLLAAYDDRLRTDAETAGALSVERHGPLLLATFPGDRALVTYRDLGGADADAVRALVVSAVGHLTRLRAEAGLAVAEWKTRGHDAAPGLHEALLGAGFVAGPEETVMLGEAAVLAVDVPLPAGVVLRRVTTEDDVRATAAMQDQVFGRPPSDRTAQAALSRLALDDGAELWVAEADRTIVGTGRLEPVPGTDVAGVWGGAVRPEWRGRGIYRALTAVRARSALDQGLRLLHSDSTPMSRPILERSGLLAVTTTTPYVLTWDEQAAGTTA
ncbi:GNAT family N-acetyltransferase [Nocardioides sp. CFH 31398]|uniref:GNAT family N-acetyltransferase n=1 Tax=Nocardioides sp. CFH 31398 TaxID=2919579 RepID=UPI001F06FA1D|nr:GNAT family N-acetyltransferase [Nocardioides sp. CFH 31398]MCH1868078.1 GNAT family N-acetyltransferase [Nocardioides sp. CFH 31398]